MPGRGAHWGCISGGLAHLTPQWEPPEGYTASPGRYINTGQLVCGRPCDHALQVPADPRRFSVEGTSDSVHRQSVGFFSCSTETGLTVQTVQIL